MSDEESEDVMTYDRLEEGKEEEEEDAEEFDTDDENYYSEPEDINEEQDAWLEDNMDQACVDGGIVEEQQGDEGAGRLQMIYDISRAQLIWERFSAELRVYLFEFIPDYVIGDLVWEDARYMAFLSASRRHRLFGDFRQQEKTIRVLMRPKKHNFFKRKQWRNLVGMRHWLRSSLRYGLVKPLELLGIWADVEIDDSKNAQWLTDDRAAEMEERRQHKTLIVASKLLAHYADDEAGPDKLEAGVIECVVFLANWDSFREGEESTKIDWASSDVQAWRHEYYKLHPPRQYPPRDLPKASIHGLEEFIRKRQGERTKESSKRDKELRRRFLVALAQMLGVEMVRELIQEAIDRKLCPPKHMALFAVSCSPFFL